MTNILFFVAGIALGYFIKGRMGVGGLSVGDVRISDKKVEGKEKILEFLRGSAEGKVTNNDVEKLLGVSDATATRYLDELEKEGKLEQVGLTGNAVYYILK